MEDGYEITVAKDGFHFFSTTLRSARIEYQAKRIYHALKNKFPEDLGYSVSVTKWECRGVSVNWIKEE